MALDEVGSNGRTGEQDRGEGVNAVRAHISSFRLPDASGPSVLTVRCIFVWTKSKRRLQRTHDTFEVTRYAQDEIKQDSRY